MRQPIPKHLLSTALFVERAYPNGVPESDYIPLLFILSEHLCDGNLSLLAATWDKHNVNMEMSESSHLNDVLLAKSLRPNSDEVMAKMIAVGFDEWAKEE